jgi:hypothetical protein
MYVKCKIDKYEAVHIYILTQIVIITQMLLTELLHFFSKGLSKVSIICSHVAHILSTLGMKLISSSGYQGFLAYSAHSLHHCTQTFVCGNGGSER